MRDLHTRMSALIYTLSLHDALPIWRSFPAIALTTDTSALTALSNDYGYEEVFARQLQGLAVAGDVLIALSTDRKSTRLNSSHLGISYAVFCLKKKNRRLSRTFR